MFVLFCSCYKYTSRYTYNYYTHSIGIKIFKNNKMYYRKYVLVEFTTLASTYTMYSLWSVKRAAYDIYLLKNYSQKTHNNNNRNIIYYISRN